MLTPSSGIIARGSGECQSKVPSSSAIGKNEFSYASIKIDAVRTDSGITAK
jgi:hypothetical protein